MKKWKQLLGSLTPQQLEPLEIRQAILDEIAALAQPLGDGRRGLVHHRILVRLRCADEARRLTIEGVLAGEEGFPSEVTRYLSERGCGVVKAPGSPPIGWRSEGTRVPRALRSSKTRYWPVPGE